MHFSCPPNQYNMSFWPQILEPCLKHVRAECAELHYGCNSLGETGGGVTDAEAISQHSGGWCTCSNPDMGTAEIVVVHYVNTKPFLL